MSTTLFDPKLSNIRTFTVAAASTVTAGWAVKFGATADTVLNQAAIGDECPGIALTSGTAGQQVDVCFPGPIIPVTVGTGGATQGARAKWVANGYTNVTAIGGGTVKLTSPGIFMQTGVAGDSVGLLHLPNTTVGT